MPDVKSKIAALLDMTVERGCTEDEAETAMRMAAAIAAKHGIDLASMTTGEQRRKIVQKNRKVKLKEHQAFCVSAGRRRPPRSNARDRPRNVRSNGSATIPSSTRRTRSASRRSTRRG